MNLTTSAHRHVFGLSPFQISDFNQRRMIRSSPSTEQDKSKEDVKKKEPEQELEVQVTFTLFHGCILHAQKNVTGTTSHTRESPVVLMCLFLFVPYVVVETNEPKQKILHQTVRSGGSFFCILASL